MVLTIKLDVSEMLVEILVCNWLGLGINNFLFYFDGTKCFYEVCQISEAEERMLPKVTLTDGSVPYDPLTRLHSRRRPVAPVDKENWKRCCLGFAPDHVVDKTLSTTTQLVLTVEAETRGIMRDHFQTRLP
jgi:hypothetical protein